MPLSICRSFLYQAAKEGMSAFVTNGRDFGRWKGKRWGDVLLEEEHVVQEDLSRKEGGQRMYSRVEGGRTAGEGLLYEYVDVLAERFVGMCFHYASNCGARIELFGCHDFALMSLIV